MKEEKYAFSLKYSTGANQNWHFACQNIAMSIGICAMCNVMHRIHMQLSSLSEFHTLVSIGSILSQQWSLSASCRIYNYDLVFQYDVRFLGLMLSELKSKCWFIKTEMEGASPFLRISQVTLKYM